MADLVHDDKHFRVSYKFPKQKAVNMNYTAPSVAALMRNLQLSENVNRDTVEFLYVHQILDNGSALELIGIEPSTGTNVTNIQAVKKDTVITGEYDDDDEILGYASGYNRDTQILEQVTKLLTHNKPRIILRAATAPASIKGFHFKAQPARPKTIEA